VGTALREENVGDDLNRVIPTPAFCDVAPDDAVVRVFEGVAKVRGCRDLLPSKTAEPPFEPPPTPAGPKYDRAERSDSTHLFAHQLPDIRVGHQWP
jgi:hypothetical protein